MTDDPVLDAATDWLIRLSERRGDLALQKDFAAWLAASPRHAEVWASLNATYGAIGQAAGVAPAARRRIIPKQAWRGVAMGLAAAMAVALFAPQLLTLLRADYRTGTAQMRTVRLADGTTVRLGPQSAIRVAYSAQARDVELLSGQALFTVTHNAARPFHVRAGDVTATDLGTVFGVRRSDAATEVGVRAGRVRVTGDGAPADLAAGDTIRADGTAASVLHGAPALAAAWADGRILARDSTIAQVIDELRPWYGGHILLADAATGMRRVNGVYDPHDVVGALQALLGNGRGDMVRITPWLIIVR